MSIKHQELDLRTEEGVSGNPGDNNSQPFFSPAPAQVPTDVSPNGPKAPSSVGDVVLTREVFDFVSTVLKQNSHSMVALNKSIGRSYWWLRLMYVLLFCVGLVAACLAIYKGFSAKDVSTAVPSLMFAGLSVGSFFSLFIIRPLESLERTTFFSSWVISIVNTYWTQVAYLDNKATFKDDLKKVTDDLIANVGKLVDKYMEVMGKLPPPEGADKTHTQPGGNQPGGNQPH